MPPAPVPERSRRFGEPHRNARGRNPPQRRALKVWAPDCLDFKTQIDNCVGVKFLGFADQRPEGLQTGSSGAVRFGCTPARGGFDAADGIICPTAFEFIGTTDLHGSTLSCYVRIRPE